MTKVIALMSMSLDGFVADADDGVAEVFDWYFSGDIAVPTASASSGMTFRVSQPSAEHLQSLVAEIGAMLTGRRTFDRADGWGGRHPWDIPAFVVTHAVRLLRRNPPPDRNPWDCTAPTRSSSAWTPGC
jgi:hypothetical protein